MNMAVFRVHKNENYTVLSNYHFKEKGLSLKAKGLLSLMLSLPENWDFSAAGLVTLSKDGKDSVNAALKELEKYGYLRRTQAYDENGKFGGYNYEIFEKPSDAILAGVRETKAEKPTTGKPFTENPSTEKPSTENPPQLNKKELNNKKLNTKISNTEEEEEGRKKPASKPTGYDAIINNLIFNEEVKKTLYEFIKMRAFIKRPLTDFALTELINKLLGISDDAQVQVEILKNSIINTYPDIYAPKEEKQQATTRDNVTPLFNTDTDEENGEKDPFDELQWIKGNVLLSENQIGDLLDKMGLDAFDFYIAKLSEYIKEHGQVKSHYATMLKWWNADRAVAR